MTSVKFETATIADAVRKAARVAPSRGSAFDKAHGLVIDLNSDSLTIKATNLDIYYTEWVSYLEIDGTGRWRLPSALMDRFLTSLPIGSNSHVTFEQNKDQIIIKHSRTQARVNLIKTEYYPEWLPFDSDNLQSVTGLGQRIAQVEWAAHTGTEVPLTGVHLDGEVAVATDRYRLAKATCPIPNLSKPVTIPAGMLTPVMRTMNDALIGIDNNLLLLMPDETTQIRTVIYDKDFPKYQRVMKRDNPDCFEVSRTQLIEVINRATNFAGADRTPLLRLYIGNEEIGAMMSNEEVGLFGDVIEIDGFADHPRVECRFTPKNLTDALAASPNDKVSISYNKENGYTIWYINGGSGYEAWVMPRKATE